MHPRITACFLLSAVLLSGCAHFDDEVRDLTARPDGWAPHIATAGQAQSGPREPIHTGVHNAWAQPDIVPAGLTGPHAVAESDGPYLLDTGDRLRIFVYGQPNLSRLYTVDHGGKIAIPLIGNVRARGRTVTQLSSSIRARLGAQYVRDPQVTVDIQENRPFFILGEVRNAGQFPYVSGMTVETAVAIAGGYSERANQTTAKLTRRINGMVEVIEAPTDYVIKPGDTVFVRERFF